MRDYWFYMTNACVDNEVLGMFKVTHGYEVEDEPPHIGWSQGNSPNIKELPNRGDDWWYSVYTWPPAMQGDSITLGFLNILPAYEYGLTFRVPSLTRNWTFHPITQAVFETHQAFDSLPECPLVVSLDDRTDAQLLVGERSHDLDVLGARC